jgi:probable F420-dependent oxidoreductase
VARVTDAAPDRPRFAIDPIGIWTWALDYAPAAQARELAAELEELGYGAIWLPEVAGRDPFVHLALLLSSTQRIVGATGIASIWARDAVTTSGATKGLTEAFPERLLFGLGVSHQNIVEDVRGHTYGKPLSTMRAYLDALDKAPYTGFRPATPVRIVLAALRPKMLELAGSRTDGAHPYFVTPEHTARARSILGPQPLLCPEQAVVLETDPEKARAIARAHTKTYVAQPNYAGSLAELGFGEDDLRDGGSDRLVDGIVAWGDTDAMLARLRAHLDAGADHVAVQVLTEGRRDIPVEGWRRLAPALRELAASRRR